MCMLEKMGVKQNTYHTQIGLKDHTLMMNLSYRVDKALAL